MNATLPPWVNVGSQCSSCSCMQTHPRLASYALVLRDATPLHPVALGGIQVLQAVMICLYPRKNSVTPIKLSLKKIDSHTIGTQKPCSATCKNVASPSEAKAGERREAQVMHSSKRGLSHIRVPVTTDVGNRRCPGQRSPSDRHSAMNPSTVCANSPDLSSMSLAVSLLG